ncbi:uncharacterized protein LOC131239932 isoform X2 [Magnolia sinica]|uniref:uncharacterized protein LOC131239932 isoform X2 n=1 Tax=Magnolia sinica TaxID=86752 RepID=UPI0026580007|nr:uncharacterized protein LOC131239932 isoform X2 [Magnolia sinica]
MPSVSFPTVSRFPAVFYQRPYLFQIQTLKMSAHATGKRPICPSCSKPVRLCLCSRIKHPPIENSIAVTILQHSHEKNHPLNSTRIASLGLKNLAIVPVSDVHFEARFDIQLMKSDLEGMNDGFECGRDRLEKPRFGWISDSVETQKEVREWCSGMAVFAAESDNGSCRDRPQKLNSDQNLDSGETQEAVRESDSKTAISAAKLENGSCRHQQEETDCHSEETQKAAGKWDSKAAIFATEFDNGVSNCHTHLQISQSHEEKLNPRQIPASPTERENAHLLNNHKQLEKSDFERVPDFSAEIETLLGSDLKTSTIAANAENGFVNGFSYHHNSQNFSEKVDFEQNPASEFGNEDRSFAVTSKIHQNNQKKTEFDMTSDSTTAKEPSLNTQKPVINLSPNQMEECMTAREDTITATIAKCNFTCSLTCLQTSQNSSKKPDFGSLSSSSIGKDAISNGFIVKRVQTKLSIGSSTKVGEFEEFNIAVPPGSALLFPSEKSIGLDSVDFKVKHLIVLDGTWAKAKRMYHENPWLKLLPHLKLDSRETSLYSEVRHQPKAGCLSTIESIVCALKALGEDSTGLDDLLNVFESMVRDQRQCKDERLSRESLAALLPPFFYPEKKE